MRSLWKFVLIGMLAPQVIAQEPLLIDACQYASDAEAQSRWVPMSRQTVPVLMGAVGGRRALRLPCRFAGDPVDRSSWNYRVALDLSRCEGIEFDLYCADPAPISSISVYFRSGGGWYHASFDVDRRSGWRTVVIPKSATREEEHPGGWDRIDLIRVSAWRSESVDTEFAITNVRRRGVLGQDTALVLVRPDSVIRGDAGSARGSLEYLETLRRHGEDLDLRTAAISDLEINDALLTSVRVLILPHNPSLPDSAALAIRRYLERGGKLLSFYGVPEGIRPATGIARGPFVQQQRPGEFAVIRFAADALPGAPATVHQQSWNLRADVPADPSGKVLAEWYDDQGRATGRPAVVRSTNTIVMTHVLLAGDDTDKRQMLLAMLGQLDPQVWEKAVRSAEARVGPIGEYLSFEEAEAALGANTSPEVVESLRMARSLRAQVATEMAAGRPHRAYEAAQSAARYWQLAYCQAQSPLAGEFRAFWCHNAYGIAGREWDVSIKALAERGMTTIIPNMMWGGGSFGRSALLPQVARPGEPDPVAACLAACRRHGIQMHLWKVNWNLGHYVPSEFAERMRREGRLQASVQGKEEPWLCPSHPDNQRLEVDSMVEAARNYSIDGLHFDYIRYPDSAHCFCAGCRERFATANNIAIASWPKDVLAGGAHRQAWLDWRRANITKVVRGVREQIELLNREKQQAGQPRVQLSAAVFREWDTDRDDVGQDWKLWCDRGYLDFVCPMDYTTSPTRFARWVERQQEWAGKVPVYAGIGASSSNSRLTPDQVILQIKTTRRFHTGGFTIFNLGREEADELLPLLNSGVTR